MENWFYLLALLSSFFSCYLLVPACKYLSKKFDLMDRPGGHKSHEDATPLLGGLAIFGGFWLGLLLCAYRGLIDWTHSLLGIFLGSTIVMIMGLIDDQYHLPPFVKFIVQVIAALLVTMFGVQADLFMGSNLVTFSVTVIWIVGITNSFNLLDNMDGLSAGVAAICCLLFSFIAYRQQDMQTLFLSLVMFGSLFAFLRFNFEPAEIFMGDAGSGFIGFFMGCLSVSANYLVQSRLRHLPIITPIMIFSLPLFDTFSVMAIRVMEGRSIWDADNKHFSHRLVSLGLTQRSAVLMNYLVTFTVGILASLLTRVNRMDAVLLLVHAVAIFGIIILLEYASAQEENSPDVL
ncbi:MAG: MraY family glycosyltransferase [bacterium]